MYILVTLNADQGVDLGPNFTLTANVGTLVPATATLTQLLAGVTVLADNDATQVIITSQGICNNSLILNVLPATTTTTSTTTTTTTTAGPTTTTTTAAPVACFSYFVYADDGTEDRNSYSYSYISCAGDVRYGARSNGGPGVTICAQEGTVTSESGFIFADEGASCNPTTTTTTTTTQAPNTYQYSATKCSDLSTVTIYYSTTLSIGSTYYVFGTPKYDCYTINSYVGLSASSPNITFTGLISDCSNTNCLQA